MENLDTVATLGTHDTGRRQTKKMQYTTQKTKMMSNMDLTNNTRGEPRYSQRIYTGSCLLQDTPILLL